MQKIESNFQDDLPKSDKRELFKVLNIIEMNAQIQVPWKLRPLNRIITGFKNDLKELIRTLHK